jgi:hypothetical protein
MVGRAEENKAGKRCERNAGQRGKEIKLKNKERKKVAKGLRYKRNLSPLNFNWFLH